MSVLADTSIWVGHLRSPLPPLDSLIVARRLVMHAAVIGELAVGNLPRRAWLLCSFAGLPSIREIAALEVLAFIERHRLQGRGLSWVDVQLLAAVDAAGHHLWTLDKRLHTSAESLGLAWNP